jgi:phage/plasmid-like protein (TIGR03299 family)
MSHFVDTMAYAGQVPWHGLGVKLDGDALASEMIAAAGLDWRVVRVPVKYVHPITGELCELENRSLLARSDTGGIVGPNAVADGFTPVQNHELFSFGDALTSTGEARWNTAGSLHDGRRVWALAQVAGQFEVRDGDVLAPYLLLYDARDKTSTFKVRFTTVRVVCANTAAMALAGKDATEISIRHTGDVAAKLDQAIEVLGLATDSFRRQQELARQLNEIAFSPTEMVGFAAQMLTGEDDPSKAAKLICESEGRSKTLYNAKALELTELFESGAGNQGKSKWDAFNSVTEFIDHQRGRMGNYRRNVAKLTPQGLDSAWFGEGERKKQRALRLLTKSS